MLNRRLINFAGAAACLSMMAFALYTEFFRIRDPCPLWHFSAYRGDRARGGFSGRGVHNPKRRGALLAYTVLVALAALATIGVAARHVYIQSQPPGSIPACGAPFNVLLQMFNPGRCW